MNLAFNPEQESLLALIHAEQQADQACYLVGGAVRDALIARPLHDMDFAMGENPVSLAKHLAKRLNVGFFVLDDDRHTARVVYTDRAGLPFPLDFVQFTGENLDEDLHHRDFTINAMAVSVRDLGVVIDPLGGQMDLSRGILQACNRNSLLDDPVRVLRAIRLAHQFEFEYAQDLKRLLVKAAPHLPESSYERQRDEFFRILEGPDPAGGVADCRQFGVFETLIPPIIEQEPIPASPPHVSPLIEHTQNVIRYYQVILESLLNDSDDSVDKAWWLEALLVKIKCFADPLGQYFNEEITPGRTKKGLALLGALLHDIGKPMTMTTGEDDRLHYLDHDVLGAKLAWEIAKRFELSNAEASWIRTIVRYHMWLLPLMKADGLPERRSVYRFYKEVDEAGIAIALLSLADTLATYETDLSPEKWHKAISVVEMMLSAWWEDGQTVIRPQLYFDGNDLQDIFGMKPGSEIGRLLDELAEGQASGEIQTIAEARVFLMKRISETNPRGLD